MSHGQRIIVPEPYSPGPYIPPPIYAAGIPYYSTNTYQQFKRRYGHI